MDSKMQEDYEEEGWIARGGVDEDQGGPLENPQETLAECLEKFSTPDYIMETGIFSQLKRYFQGMSL